MDLFDWDPQRNLPFLRIANHEHLFHIVGKDLQRQLSFLHPPFPTQQKTAPAFLDRREHTLDDGSEMVDGKPCFCIMFVCSKRDNPCWLAFGFTSGIFSETEVRRPVFIGHELTVVPRGERFVSQDVAKFREVFDQVFELLGIVSIPWCSGKPVDYTGVDIDADVEFDAVFSSALSFDPDVVPGAAVVGAESAAVNSDVHLFPSEKSGDSVHHLAYVSDGESFHAALDHAMPWKNRAAFSEGLAVLDLCFNAVVGLIKSYFKETSYCYGLRIMSSSSLLVGFPWWWQLVYRFNHRLSEIGGEIAVHMVRNCWINPFLRASHPVKKECFLLNYLFRDEAVNLEKYINI